MIVWTRIQTEKLREINHICTVTYVHGKRNPSKTVGVARGHQRADTLKL